MRPRTVVGDPSALASALLAEVGRVVEEKGRISLALAGGSVAEAFFPALAEALRGTAADFYWGDERAVSPDDPDSNFALARRLLLEPLGAPFERVHRMPADRPDLEAAARDHERELTAALGTPPRLDLVLLGVGPDGHVCSLFPGHSALLEQGRFVVAVEDSPKPPPRRLTLTLPVLEAAGLVVVAAFGEAKAEAVRAALEDPSSMLPVALVARGARVLFLLDPAAARRLTPHGESKARAQAAAPARRYNPLRRPERKRGPMKKTSELTNPFRVRNGKGFRLKDVDPTDTLGIASKEKATELLRRGVERMADLHEKLYAQNQWALLLIFQAMDAAGKDGTIKHVMSGLNPQGCQVYSFKTPSPEERDHDYLWRNMKSMPERGRIGVFNRSYYEEVLVVRVHPEYLAGQQIPSSLLSKRIWEERFEDINAYERYLSRNGIKVLKFFLHVSRKEQKRRFLERIEQKAKNWKFSSADAMERQHWKEYMRAYEDMIQHTATKESPWYVVPADHKWFTRIVVAAAVIEALESMKLAFPDISPAQERELSASRAILEGEDKPNAKKRAASVVRRTARAKKGAA
jgi:PPK2 family polyphosphate:nucleotide phosphotransferase